jgi:hypothetical protein
MGIIKNTIKGHKGTTVVFSIPNATITGNLLTWETFRFYTPEGNQDENGNKYFAIPAEQVDISRDPELYREIFVFCQEGQITAKGYYEGENIALPDFGLKGDMLFIIRMPPEENGNEIKIEQREVIDDNS